MLGGEHVVGEHVAVLLDVLRSTLFDSDSCFSYGVRNIC